MKQFRIQKEREKAEILENLEEVENKLKLAKILDDLDSAEKSDKHQIGSTRGGSRINLGCLKILQNKN